MKPESIAFAIAGVLFGLLAGWIIGSQQATAVRSGASASAESAAAAPQTNARAERLDMAKVSALEALADKEPSNARPRTELGNLYFDAERYDEAIRWYSDAFKLDPKDPNLSTDLGVSYYYTNQPDKALEQFAKSLAADPKHLKTLLNMGIVKAFGKQDLEGAEAAWQQVLQLAPDSPEGLSAKRALDSLRSAHPGGTGAKSGG
ncbi:MAG: tetratricopeptide repeat protein [Acidimicrobiia bacterium]|nr:tetratricopeptide repeat protein [Acidimicrobiia bacterium]